MNGDKELKLCPFCGSEYLVPGYDKYAKFVRCNVCGATGPRVNALTIFKTKKKLKCGIPGLRNKHE